jgi:hypothetical protein
MSYKKKWGYQIVKESGAGFFIKVMNASTGTRSFLFHNPYINVDKGGNSIVFFIDSKEDVQDTLDRIRCNFLPKGLDWIVISTLSADASIRQIFKTPVEITKQL